jgi:hypothetical protein
MDKVKQYLELARKHHFWVLCIIAIVAGVVAWYLSSSKLSAEFKANSSQIDGTFTSLKGVPPDQPHDDWTPGYNKETQAVSQDVLAAWKELYQQQKDKVFVWPKELSQDFRDAANQISDPNAVIPRKLREYYQSMVKQQVDRLPAIVDAPTLDELAGGGTTEQEHSVDWSQSSLKGIEESFDWSERPSTLLIKFAQEELWVYQALCHVIKSANEGSNGKHDSVVQEIQAMDIAYDAVEDSPGGSGRIESITGSGGGPAVPSGPGGPGTANARPDPRTRGKREASRGSFSFGGGEAAAAPTNPDDLWKTYRYVNLDGTAKPGGEADAPGGEFNLMPFRLLLKMDSRYIDKLLVAFRNSDLPFEVQQVRINPEHASASAGGGGGGGGRFSRPGGPPSGPPMGGPPIGGGMGPPIGGSGRMGGGNRSNGETQQHDRTVTVEIRGVAYLIKPPDLQKLHVAPATDAAPADAASTVATPAGVTAPAPAQVEAGAVGNVIKQVGDQPAAAPGENPTPPPATSPAPAATTPESTPAAESNPTTTPPAAAEAPANAPQQPAP